MLNLRLEGWFGIDPADGVMGWGLDVLRVGPVPRRSSAAARGEGKGGRIGTTPLCDRIRCYDITNGCGVMCVVFGDWFYVGTSVSASMQNLFLFRHLPALTKSRFNRTH